MMRSLKKKSDLGIGSHCVSGQSSNPDGAPKLNPDVVAEKSGDSNDDDDDDMDEDDLNPDGAATLHYDPYKVGSAPGSSRHHKNHVTEVLRRSQWLNDWHVPSSDISFNQAHAHLKHSVNAIESEELKSHLKTTGILLKGVKSELSKLNDKMEGIKDYVDTSIGRMNTKSQVVTIITNQEALQKSQKLIQELMKAMDAKFDLLISSLQNVDAKKGEKALVTKCGPELKPNPDDKEGGEGGGDEGKIKEPAAVISVNVQQRYIAAGSSSKAADSSSGQGHSQHLQMDSTLMLDPETISKKFTQEIEIGGRRERLFYRDPRIQEANEELARNLNHELNPDYNFEESLEEQRKAEKKKTPKAPRGRGKGRGRGRTQSMPARPIERGILQEGELHSRKATITYSTGTKAI